MLDLLILEIRTAEEFDRIKPLIDTQRRRLTSNTFRLIRTQEVCQCFIDYSLKCANVLTDTRSVSMKQFIRGGFYYYFGKKNTQYLRLFLPHVNLLAETRTISFSFNLEQAVSSGCVDLRSMLLENGLDVNFAIGSRTMLFFACVDQQEMVKLLIDKQANVNHRCVFNTSPLSIATNSDNKAIIDLLIDAGASIKT